MKSRCRPPRQRRQQRLVEMQRGGRCRDGARPLGPDGLVILGVLRVSGARARRCRVAAASRPPPAAPRRKRRAARRKRRAAPGPPRGRHHCREPGARTRCLARADRRAGRSSACQLSRPVARSSVASIRAIACAVGARRGAASPASRAGITLVSFSTSRSPGRSQCGRSATVASCVAAPSATSSRAAHRGRAGRSRDQLLGQVEVEIGELHGRLLPRAAQPASAAPPARTSRSASTSRMPPSTLWKNRSSMRSRMRRPTTVPAKPVVTIAAISGSQGP